MTARRASFLVLLAAALSFWTWAMGCNLDSSGYGETEDVCTTKANCDDNNVCTEDTCGPDGICVHKILPDGQFPDGVTGNCKVFACKGGVQSEVPLPDDVSDGDECTLDTCTPNGPMHVLQQGATCHQGGGLGTCDAMGKCSISCGYTDPDGKEVGCPESMDKCSVSYCDKANGKCALDALDGVAEPGTTPGQCGGSYCVAGKATGKFADVGTPCSGMTPKGSAAIVCDGSGACVACNTADDCNPKGTPPSYCFSASCVAHECVVDQKPDGTVLPANQQVDKDCLEKQCKDAIIVEVPKDTDLPDDGNKCTTDTCSNGTEVFTPTPLNSPCGVNGDLFCDGKTHCLGCTMNGQCGTDTDCHQYVCNAGNCMDKYPLDGTPLPAAKQTSGDCLQQVCDGTGGVKPKADDSDLPDDGNDCTLNQCSGGSKVFPPVNAGSTCLSTRVCDGTGHCLGGGCQSAADCPMGSFCVDGVCCNSQCNTTCQACSNMLKGTGLDGDCGVSAPNTDYMDLDCPGPKVCDGTVGASACKLPNGQGCGANGDCVSGNCIDGVCCNTACTGLCQSCNLGGTVGTCTSIPNGQDPANECSGTTSCNGSGACTTLALGATCGANVECGSGNCVDTVCCNTTCTGTCQACNLSGSMGTCTSIPAGQDPAMECPGVTNCNGGGACTLLGIGSACSQNAECGSGFCADGVCCNSACNGTCQSCSLAGTVGACTNIPSGGTDNNPVCGGTSVCDGSGGCKKGDGVSCGGNSECLHGNCVDMVCCNTACSGLCQACNLGGSTGTCTNIPNGQDPANECSGTTSCNGSGACTTLALGATCGANVECGSGNCVDTVCCNTTCTGTCQACNLSGSMGTCTSIPAGQDPAMECPGVTNCNGGGACTLLGIGSACSQNAECGSGFCADGVCCSTPTCSGTCMSCNQANTVGGVAGVCDSIKAGTDPDMECTGAKVCDGMASPACIGGPLGAACGGDTECASTFCTDNVCCTVNSCGAQTCSAADGMCH
jgi:hypothetical protein